MSNVVSQSAAKAFIRTKNVSVSLAKMKIVFLVLTKSVDHVKKHTFYILNNVCNVKKIVSYVHLVTIAMFVWMDIFCRKVSA